MNEWYRNYNSLAGWSLSEICTDSKVIYMKNGCLAKEISQTFRESIEEIGEAVLDFSTYLEDAGRENTAFTPDRVSYTCIPPRFESDFVVEILSRREWCGRFLQGNIL